MNRTRFALVLACVCLAPAAQATVTGLYNSGVDDDGVALPDSPGSRGTPDPHYNFAIVDPQPVALSAQSSASLYYNGAYFPDSATSRWISVNGIGGVDDETYNDATVDFSTTFTISAIDPSLVTITGRWAADDRGLDILVNGISSGFTVAGFGGYASFTLNGGFRDGINTLDFLVRDDGVPLALRVDGLTATEATAAVPEPASWAMMVGGFGLVGGALRRRARTVRFA